MASILYVFPHPDDESFGPAPAMAKQRRGGHAVHLLTLTRGEATQQRHKFGYSKEKMGDVRYDEMQGVADALDLASLTVLEFPDGDLAEQDPLALEQAVIDRVEAVAPQVVVTYPVHGISGHPDHLVSHHLVKRVFCALRADGAPSLQRLAFFTLSEAGAGADRPDHLQGSPEAAIDVIERFVDADRARAESALDCYVTYQDVVEEHDPLGTVADGVRFELFQETHTPPLDTLTAGLSTD
jgi:LmbE family N-acetylglucosaminyl deacetylase